MKLFICEGLPPLLALACAAVVFGASALDLPDEPRAVAAAAPQAR